MDDAIRDLSADAVIMVGGWDPRYARVLLIEHEENNALVLVDGNGDGAELELEYWHRDHGDGLWRGGRPGYRLPLPGQVLRDPAVRQLALAEHERLHVLRPVGVNTAGAAAARRRAR